MGKLSYTVKGDSTKPSLLLLHGFMSSNLQWEINEKALLETYHLINVELLGHGDSPEPQTIEAYSVTTYLNEFERIRRELGLTRWFLCGQSYAGGIVLRYAHDFPDRVRGVIFTNSRSALSAEVPRDVKENMPDDWSKFNPRELPYHPAHAKRFPKELKQRMAEKADRIAPQILFRSTNIAGKQLSCRTIAGLIRPPVLLINGKWEKKFQEYRDFAEVTIPNIQVIDLEGGHSVNIEEPEGFNQAVCEFGHRYS